MSVSNCFRLAACRQLLPTELPNCLQHLVSRHAIAPSSLSEQTVFDQGGDSIQEVRGERGRAIAPFVVNSPSGGPRGLKREPANEHREAAEQRLLSFVEEVVAPADRVAHRLLAQGEIPGAAAEQ